jgi:hypothetical protein
MILLNGAQGLSDVLAQALSQGVTGLQMARNLLSGANSFGVGSNGSGTNGRADDADLANGRHRDAPAPAVERGSDKT